MLKALFFHAALVGRRSMRHISPINSIRYFLASLIVLALGAGSAQAAAEAGRRVALVIGNSAYHNITRLKNPINDATDIAAKLEALKFVVVLATDASHDEMQRQIIRFRDALTPNDIALIFYAGHGVTVSGESFLLPVDVPSVMDIDGDGKIKQQDLQSNLVSMSNLLAPLDKARLGIVFLDACRNDANDADLGLSFRSAGARNVPVLRGLATPNLGRSPHSAGVYRAYATQLNNAASDGQDRNSPFTRALLQHIATPKINLQELMMRVRQSVMRETEDKQVPWEEGALNEYFYFVPPETTAPPVTSARPSDARPVDESAGPKREQKGPAAAPPARVKQATKPSSSGSKSQAKSQGSPKVVYKSGGGAKPKSGSANRLPPNIGVGVGGGL